MESDKDPLVKEMDDLILSIKSHKPLISEEDLMQELGYNIGYASQARSRNKVSPKFIAKLKDHIGTLQNATDQPEAILITLQKLADSNHVLALAQQDIAASNRDLVNMLKGSIGSDQERTLQAVASSVGKLQVFVKDFAVDPRKRKQEDVVVALGISKTDKTKKAL